MSEIMQQLQTAQFEAAEEARRIVAEYVYEACNCEYCHKYQHVRYDLTKIARAHDNSRISSTLLWLVYRDHIKSEDT